LGAEIGAGRSGAGWGGATTAISISLAPSGQDANESQGAPDDGAAYPDAVPGRLRQCHLIWFRRRQRASVGPQRRPKWPEAAGRGRRPTRPEDAQGHPMRSLRVPPFPQDPRPPPKAPCAFISFLGHNRKERKPTLLAHSKTIHFGMVGDAMRRPAARTAALLASMTATRVVRKYHPSWKRRVLGAFVTC